MDTSDSSSATIRTITSTLFSELATRWQHRLDRRLLISCYQKLTARKICVETTGVLKRLSETSFSGDSSSFHPAGYETIPDQLLNTRPPKIIVSFIMPFTADAAATQIQERLKNIYNLVHEIENQRVRSEHNLNNIMKTHEKVTPDDKVSPYYQQKEEILRKALSKINEIRTIRNERRIQARQAGNKETIRRGALMKMLLSTAQTLPLYVGKTPGGKPPPLCGAIPAEPTYIAKMGDMVAALVKGNEEGENWILAEVVQFIVATNKYEVDDIDEEQKDRHTLSRRRVVPLPLMRANPETDPHALFSKGSTVMALYPQTTCFYKAIVQRQPSTATEEYLILFEDAAYETGYSPPLSIAQRYVISIKESKKNKSQC
ncbi:SAGA-associated factor 29-like protein [Acromyrmex echinatior]|uniref:SAGA-associated factor 29-like protein n=2 Tax=Acromyrmex echinatior TaxID=103372 RepID=F4WI07_ACREC|nr:SAGA-associated factor 29-like protein [Acromyrmex echinatior]